MTLTLSAYQPGSALDDELAHLCHRAIRGRTDQRPVTADLVASRLTAGAGQPPTLLATGRDPGGQLIAAAALRWPYVPTGIGRLWGPVVHPHHQHQGLATDLLTMIIERCGGLRELPALTTTEIPSAAAAAHALFTQAGWIRLQGPLLFRGPTTPGPVPLSLATIRTARTVEARSLAGQLRRLYAATYPDHDPATAYDTLRRWSADRRYDPSGLLLVGPTDRPTAAALFYPLSPRADDEPAELLIADILTDPKHATADLIAGCRTLVRAALHHGATQGATVARAILPAHRTHAIAALEFAGLTRHDSFTLFAPPRLPARATPP